MLLKNKEKKENIDKEQGRKENNKDNDDSNQEKKKDRKVKKVLTWFNTPWFFYIPNIP